MYRPLPPPAPWTVADEAAWAELGRERPAPSYEISNRMSEAVDVDALSDQEFNARFELLGCPDARFDARFNESVEHAKAAGSGRLLCEDEAHLRRPLYGQSSRVEDVDDDRRSKRSGTNANLWRT